MRASQPGGLGTAQPNVISPRNQLSNNQDILNVNGHSMTSNGGGLLSHRTHGRYQQRTATNFGGAIGPFLSGSLGAKSNGAIAINAK